MSDFDKEAERERLREQYEREQQRREATEHMSDLLLKGATMTDAHCEECGDPIFRYDGQEFCPTCQQTVQSEADQSTEDSAAASQTAETRVSDTAEPAAPEQSEASQSTLDSQQGGATSGRSRGGSAQERATSAPSPNRGAQPPATDSPGGDLAEAHESLVAALVTFSQQARSIDDPRLATDALEAAREAAEALAALDQVR